MMLHDRVIPAGQFVGGGGLLLLEQLVNRSRGIEWIQMMGVQRLLNVVGSQCSTGLQLFERVQLLGALEPSMNELGNQSCKSTSFTRQPSPSEKPGAGRQYTRGRWLR